MHPDPVFPHMELLVGRLMNRCTQGAIKAEFDKLQNALGNAFGFSCVFPVILTDRGSEFGDPESLEHDRNGHARTSIFYCDPMRSCQKGGIENVHTMLRMILPKDTVFENLTQWDIRRAVDHVNNAPRRKPGGHTPYELAFKTFGAGTLKNFKFFMTACGI